jgi:hypothetical protein
MRLVPDQGPVEDLPAAGADPPLQDRSREAPAPGS